MKKIFTFLFFGLLATASVMQAQDIDESYVFVDEDGNVIDNGATIVRNELGVYLDGRDVIRSGVSVYNQSGNTAVDYLKVYYDIERIDNGSYQICFPSTCNEQSMVGSYETGRGQLMGNLQDIQSEWFTQGEGECIVTLTIEILDRESGFPPSYTHRSWGPSITLRFVNGDIEPEPLDGDVNLDGEVNIADVNAVIDKILSQSTDPAADVNGDGEVNIADVNAVINIIMANN